MAGLRKSALIALIVFTSSTALVQSQQQPNRTPVLVELFTSEGCSSCPPADNLLARLSQEQPVSNANIIVLEEHVDYWDKGGWHDRFSSSQFTYRQNLYAPRLKFDEPYTPQMVVDGTDQFVGNDGPRALHAITQASQTPKLSLSLSAPVVDGRRIAGTVSAAAPGDLPKGDLYLVLVDATASTEVKAGENGGHKLQHVCVVRSMQKIGKLQDLGPGPVKFSVNVPKDSDPANSRIVVFAQKANQGPVLGAATVPLTQ